jgi:hypothetical protein
MTAVLWAQRFGPAHGITRSGVLGGWTGTGDQTAACDANQAHHLDEVYRFRVGPDEPMRAHGWLSRTARAWRRSAAVGSMRWSD